MDKKSIQEWFESAEQPYRDQLLANMMNSVREIKIHSLKYALGSGFIWRDSIEGEDYWMEYANTLK